MSDQYLQQLDRITTAVGTELVPISDDPSGAGRLKAITVDDLLATVEVVVDHGALTGLSDDDHTQYALLAGRAGGQTLIGGTGSTDALVMSSAAGVIVQAAAASQSDPIADVADASGNSLVRFGDRISQANATLVAVNADKQLIQSDIVTVYGYQDSRFVLEASADGTPVRSPRFQMRGSWGSSRPYAQWEFVPTGGATGYLEYNVSGSTGFTVYRHENRSAIVGINETTATAAMLNVRPNWSGKIGVAVRADAAQTANLIECKNSSGTRLSGFGPNGALLLPVFTDATRPTAGVAGRVIFNSDDGKINIDTGSQWTLPDGTIT